MGGFSDLVFDPGLRFEALVKQRFDSMVSPISSTSGFHLVASFSRAALRINVESTCLILQSCLRGQAVEFMVHWLKDWCFKFSLLKGSGAYDSSPLEGV